MTAKGIAAKTTLAQKFIAANPSAKPGSQKVIYAK
jgi:hypothetical protein